MGFQICVKRAAYLDATQNKFRIKPDKPQDRSMRDTTTYRVDVFYLLSHKRISQRKESNHLPFQMNITNGFLMPSPLALLACYC